MPWPTSVSEYRGSGPLRAVVSGLGAVRERLAAHLVDQNVTRPMIVCGESVSRSPVLDLVREALGDVWSPFVFDGSRPHTPVETVAAGAAAARAADVDALIAVGGGSTMDCARGIAVLLARGLDDVTQLTPAEFGKLGQRGPERADPGGPPMPVACVSTALSFAELLPFWGSRHADIARKRPYLEDGHVVRTVFLDGEVASHTPGSVWCETGVKALDDALMGFCRAPDVEPFADPVLISAISALGTLLPRSRAEGTIVERQHVLTAAWMTKFNLPKLAGGPGGGWFSTTARHSLGAVLEVPHGVGSCVALLPGIRFHAARHRRAAGRAEARRELGRQRDLRLARRSRGRAARTTARADAPLRDRRRRHAPRRRGRGDGRRSPLARHARAAPRRLRPRCSDAWRRSTTHFLAFSDARTREVRPPAVPRSSSGRRAASAQPDAATGTSATAVATSAATTPNAAPIATIATASCTTITARRTGSPSASKRRCSSNSSAVLRSRAVSSTARPRTSPNRMPSARAAIGPAVSAPMAMVRNTAAVMM